MNKAIAFLGSFIITFGIVSFVLQNQNRKPEVLALELDSPIFTPIPTPTAKPTPKITPTPKPIPTSTPTPTPTLKPSFSPTPTPQVSEPTATPDVWSPPALEGWFSQYSAQYGVDKNLLERIANCESHFNPESKNDDYVGLFQFSTSTWINYRNLMGLDPNPALRTNPEESIKTGAFLVSKRGSAPWPSCV